GDASVNHSTALGALNAAGWVSHQNLKLPLLFVCEDNGLGISVRTPPGWITERVRALPHIRPFLARGWDLNETWRVAQEAVEYCRTLRQPALLHIPCVRLLGHAGSDVDTSYRSQQEIDEACDRDPVLCHALALLATGRVAREQLLAQHDAAQARVRAAQELARSSPTLSSRTQVMAALTGVTRSRVAASLVSTPAPKAGANAESSRRELLSPEEKLTLAQGLNRGLADLLQQHPQALLFGEDVAKKGGVYGVTKGLFERFGALRVFNTLLDEQTILGLALGSSLAGLLPVAEIQYLAYLHNAEDQLRGEASTLRFFSNAEYDNPLILRVAGLAYQKGFGGHFHNDNSLAVLRDLPGVVVAIPARSDDALALLRSCRQLALEQGRVCVLVEPIALYHRRGLLQEEDGLWLAADDGRTAEFGRARVYHETAPDLTILTYGNGLALSLAAAQRLRAQNIGARVLDLRWLAPLPEQDILEHAAKTGRVLVVDECRHSGNVSEQIAATLLDAGYQGAFRRVTGADSFIPLGEAARHVLVSEDEIVEAARSLAALTAPDPLASWAKQLPPQIGKLWRSLRKAL
ncbi:MAG TPA: transketolase C-terminal domain-containing protein, partial [Polyangiaceae bacterium]|nr:transketolase C-terminal domain-containing protein [Polyangiaceae bacterium]